MPVSINDFWKLAAASGLLSPARCQQLHAAFASMKGASRQANTLSLAQWLVAGGMLSRYQASLLAAGRPGPFIFGDFVISERIETGRFARLFRATRQNQQSVLLVFTAQLTSDPDSADWIAERMLAALGVDSPHVSRVLQFVEGPPHAFGVVEDLQGQTLGEYLGKHKPSLETACRIGFHAALGLVAMHARKTAHGGLCPDNVWIEPSGTVKLLQFPLVPIATPQDRLELPMADYSAPELATSPEAASALGDIYALGCTLYELIAGRVLFPGRIAKQKLDRHQSEIPPRLDRLISGVPEELADLVAEMVDKEPLLRTRTASQVAHLLAPFTADASGGQLRGGRPPRLDSETLTPGYGAWKAPTWRAPPQQTKPTQQPADEAQAVSRPAKEPTAEVAPLSVQDRAQASEAARDPQAAPEFPTNASRERAQSAALPDGTDSGSRLAVEESWEPPLFPTRSVAGESAQPASRRLSTRALVALAGGAILFAAIVVGVLVIALQGDGPGEAVPAAVGGNVPQQGSDREPAQGAAPSTATAPAAQAAGGDRPPSISREKAWTKSAAVEVEDDGHSLWVSPTAGEPVTLNYLPSSAQVFMILRPAELLESSDGAKLIGALGPGGAWAIGQLRSVLGVDLAEIEQLQIAFFPDDSDIPQAAFAMRLRKAIPQAVLLEAWGTPAPAEHKSKPFFQRSRWAYFLPNGAESRVVAIAPPAAMHEILDRDSPPLVRRAIERLLGDSDAARHFTLLLAPSYLLTDGKSLLVGDLDKLRDPLAQFLDESIAAVLFSAHLGSDLFLEFRALGAIDKRPQELADLVRGRLERVPELVENYVASLQPHPYGRLIVNRFPRMVQLLNDHTRAGVEGQQAVLRCYLPRDAAHNLLLGVELTLFEQPPAAGTAATRPAVKERASAAAALAKSISLSFPRDTLDGCMDLLGKELGVDVVILGSDLQSEGIAKNKSFGLDERERPAGEVLRHALKTVDPTGKLIYVIKPRDGREAVFITTRAAAAKRGDPLPQEFALETSKQ